MGLKFFLYVHHSLLRTSSVMRALSGEGRGTHTWLSESSRISSSFILLDLPCGSLYFCPSTQTVPLRGGGAISGNVTNSYGTSISSIANDRVIHVVHYTLTYVSILLCCLRIIRTKQPWPLTLCKVYHEMTACIATSATAVLAPNHWPYTVTVEGRVIWRDKVPWAFSGKPIRMLDLPTVIMSRGTPRLPGSQYIQ